MGSAPWYEKYSYLSSGRLEDVGKNVGSLTVFDFSDVDNIPESDWVEAQKIEREEIERRNGFLAEAEKAMYKNVSGMPSARLSDGNTIPLIGLGTWKAEKGQVKEAVYHALKAGYRHIDCASVYQNEDEVGDALHHVTSRLLVDRNDLFICSKVWNIDHSALNVRKACINSLKALKLDYLDLYLIHWPVTGNVGEQVQPSIQETWQAMESLVKDGLVRSIGVSNFSVKKLEDILRYAEIPPAVCQVEIHPYHRNDRLVAWCRDHDIHVTAFSPLGSPDSESIFPRKVPAVLMEDPRVQRVAQRSGKNVGQVLIRWALQHGTSVIPKSTNPSRIQGNLDVLDWRLSDGDYDLLSGIKFQQRMVNGGMWLNAKGPYRTMQDLWDEPEVDMDDVLQGLSEEDLYFPLREKKEDYKVADIPMLELRDGNSIPAVGLGTWKAEKGQVRDAVYHAIKCGYRHIDCASIYQNEEEVGDVLKHVISKGYVSRDSLFVCSKLWNTDHAPNRVRSAFLSSIKALKLDYLDLYLIHWPVTGNVGEQVQPSIQETWQAMESLVKDGLVRSIGVSNFSVKKLEDILRYAEIPPAVCQVEIHPYHRNDRLVAWCRDHDIHVTAFSPLGSPDSESIFPRKVPAVLMEDPRVQRVAQRSGKNVGQVLIRWALQHGTSVIPKSTNPSRIQGNLDVLDWRLSDGDYDLLSGIKFQQRMVNGGMWLNAKGPYRTMQDLWDEPEVYPEHLDIEDNGDDDYASEEKSEKSRTVSLSHPIQVDTSPTSSSYEEVSEDGSAYASVDGSSPEKEARDDGNAEASWSKKIGSWLGGRK